MTGDFTRNGFRPDRDFSAVRMQQGRVLMDADWNEEADIARWFARVTNGDVIGPSGFPQDAAGFGLVTTGGDLAIMPGRGYVDGILVRCAAPAPVRLERVSGSGANTLYRVAEGPPLVAGQPLLQPGQKLPPDEGKLDAVAVRELSLDGEGRQQVRLSASLGAGATKDLIAGASVGAQPHLPGQVLPTTAGDYLAYLEVWERPIGVIEDPLLAEVALGGPDTCLRDQIVWQVKLLDLAKLIEDGDVPKPPSCKSFPPGWRPDGGAAPARLAARAEAASAANDPCALPAAGGYRSLENHLYRVEIHNGGEAGAAKRTYKWSRDNAMHRARLLEVANGALVVDSPGRDEPTAYRNGDWLEVLDEVRILAGRPGFFVRLAEVNANRLGVAEVLDPETLAPLVDNNLPDTAKLPSSGILRRFEGGRPAELKLGEWLALENGVEVQIADGFLLSGDFWTVPARTVTADVEWPRDASSGLPAFRAPEGIARHFAALAIVGLDNAGNWSVAGDCRNLFPPLGELETFHYLGGDGQEATPDLTKATTRVALGAPLRVGVARGETPVAGRLVRFTVEEASNAAQLSALAGSDVVSATPSVLILRSDAEGIASANLALHPRRQRHHVTAELLDSGVPEQADRSHLPIRFTANLSTAAETAYDPAACAFQQAKLGAEGTSITVQQAIDKLCPPPELRVLGGNGQLLCKGQPAPEAIRVGLYWGKAPLAGVKLDLAVVQGDAKVDPASVTTGADGTATAKLVAGGDPLKDGGAVRILVKPSGAPAPTRPETLELFARFPNAACVYVDRDVCPRGQQAENDNTVAALLRFLCRQTPGTADGIRVKQIALTNPARPLIARSSIAPNDLAAGLTIALDRPVDPETVKLGPVGKVVVDLPSPAPGSPTEQFYGINGDFRLPLVVEHELAGQFIVDSAEAALRWQPAPRSAQRWLAAEARSFLARLRDGHRIGFLEARLVLHGARIWARESRELFLDGDLFLDPRDPTGARYPSGNGTPGGDLVLPFRFGTG